MTEKAYAIKWDKSYLIGIPVIDSQHRRLLQKMELLLNAIINKKGDAEIGSILKFLQFYVEGHFGIEEKLMREFNFPSIDLHKKQHNRFTGLIREYQNIFGIEGGSHALAVRLEKNLLTWYQNHIMTQDKELGTYLKEHKSFREDSEIRQLLEQVYDAIDDYLISISKDERLRNLKNAQNLLFIVEKAIAKEPD